MRNLKTLFEGIFDTDKLDDKLWNDTPKLFWQRVQECTGGRARTNKEYIEFFRNPEVLNRMIEWLKENSTSNDLEYILKSDRYNGISITTDNDPTLRIWYPDGLRVMRMNFTFTPKEVEYFCARVSPEEWKMNLIVTKKNKSAYVIKESQWRKLK